MLLDGYNNCFTSGKQCRKGGIFPIKCLQLFSTIELCSNTPVTINAVFNKKKQQ